MKIKKVIFLLGSITLSTTAVSSVIACSSHSHKSDNQIDRWNLSTWTGTQKQEINKKFLSIPIYDKTWEEYNHFNFINEVNSAFMNINSWIKIGSNVAWSISPIPHDNDNVFDIFKNGLTLSVKGIKDGVTGEMTLILKGNRISIWNLSTWTGTQKQEINKKFLSIPTSYDTWGSSGSRSVDQGYEKKQFLRDLNESFGVINNHISFDSNVDRSISPIPHDNDNVFDIFKNGLTLSVKGIKDGVTGSMTLLLRGTKKIESS